MAEQSAHTRTIPLTHLSESPTNPRKYYDEAALQELAASIVERGVLQPILVRPQADDHYEIVAGHRRTRAAALAGKVEIEAVVRELSDEEVFEIQLIENLQREDLTPLEEGESYAALDAAGLSVKEIATRVSKKPKDIASRIALARLADPVKALLGKGTLPLEHAELLARIPDHDYQVHALGRMFTEDWAGPERQKRIKVPVALAVAKSIIQSAYMLALSSAPFDPEDAALSPLGKCSTCIYRTGNNRDLFGDIKGKDICTNAADFEVKVQAFLERKREDGYAVLLTPEEVRTAFPSPHNDHHLADGWIDLEQRCYQDAKQRTFAKLLTADQRRKATLVWFRGRMRTLYRKEALVEALEERGISAFQPTQKVPLTDAERERRAKEKEDKAIRKAIQADFAEKVRTSRVSATTFVDLLLRIVIEDRMWQLDEILPRHGFEGTRAELGANRQANAKALTELPDAAKRAVILDSYLASWVGPNATPHKRTLAYDAMALFGVDVKAIEKRIRTELKAKQKDRDAKPAKAA
jgi:ParB/RepB/Spo0J family partition protein